MFKFNVVSILHSFIYDLVILCSKKYIFFARKNELLETFRQGKYLEKFVNSSKLTLQTTIKKLGYIKRPKRAFQLVIISIEKPKNQFFSAEKTRFGDRYQKFSNQS